MSRERFRKLKEVLATAVELPAGERAGYVEQACGNDADLRREVEAKLAHLDRGPSVLRTDGARAALETAGIPTLAADPAEAPDRDLAGRVLSHYRIEKRLGAGGMGEVWLAHDLALDRRVALKVLAPGFRPAIRDRLLQEAWNSSRVQHPAIATFHEAGQADGIDFIAMQYVEGRTLREELRDGPLPVDRALEIAGTVLEGLVHAHFSGILHRDIKPENVMIATDGSAKLLDFGLAKGLLMEVDDEAEASSAEVTVPDEGDSVLTLATDATLDQEAEGLAELTRAGVIVGTPGYMPPEQLRGEHLDARADVFAVGAVLYGMLAGQSAFPGRTLHERCDAILHRDPDPLDDARVPGEIASVVVRALARDRADRPASAAAMLADLRHAGGGDPGSQLPIRLALADLRNLTGDDEVAWIGSAVPEAIATSLAKLPRVQVMPRERVLKGLSEASSEVDLGLRLGCSAVVSGTFETSGDELAITLKVTDVATGLLLADDSLRGTRGRIFELQDRFTAIVASALNREVAESSRAAPQLAAYECYARGRRLVWSTDRASFEEARELLERAVELDPHYARALASLAHMHAWAYHSTSDPKRVSIALDYAQRAIAADPELPEAHLWAGYVLGFEGPATDAVKARERAIELDPDNFLTLYFARSAVYTGSFSRVEAQEVVRACNGPPQVEDPYGWLRQQALEANQRVVELNPAFCWGWLALGWIHLECGRFEESRWCLERAVKLEPTAVPPTAGVAGYLGECLRRSGHLVEARERFREALASVERTDHMYRDLWRGLFLCGLGRTTLQQGDRHAAEAAFNQAVLHLRGRHQARCGGHVMVQALAGLARVREDPEAFEEALQLFWERSDYEFTWLWGCSDDVDLIELSRAATTIGRDELAGQLRAEAIDRGSPEACAEGSN